MWSGKRKGAFWLLFNNCAHTLCVFPEKCIMYGYFFAFENIYNFLSFCHCFDQGRCSCPEAPCGCYKDEKASHRVKRCLSIHLIKCQIVVIKDEKASHVKQKQSKEKPQFSSNLKCLHKNIHIYCLLAIFKLRLIQSILQAKLWIIFLMAFLNK